MLRTNVRLLDINITHSILDIILIFNLVDYAFLLLVTTQLQNFSNFASHKNIDIILIFNLVDYAFLLLVTTQLQNFSNFASHKNITHKSVIFSQVIYLIQLRIGKHIRISTYIGCLLMKEFS
jgi:hypothetical protein